MNIKSLFKLYTIPILALFLGFGLYYAIFIGTNKQKEDSSVEDFSPAVLAQPQMNYHKEEDKIEESSKNINNTDVSSEIVANSQSDDVKNIASSAPLLSNPSNPPLNDSSKIDEAPKILKHPSLYTVLGKTLNIRESPDISSEIIGKLSYKQNIEVEFIRDDWAKLKEKGWVYARLLQPVQDSNIAGAPQNKISSTQIYKTSAVVNVRSEPSISSKVVSKLSPNESVEVKSIQNGWAKIDRGFVLLDLLTRQSDNPTQ